MNKTVGIITILLLPALGLAQATSPYGGEQTRDIKALSQAQIEGLRNGHGMGYGKAAELNHSPGPKHVLELAGRLKLSADQIEKTNAIYTQMHQAAVALGKQYVQREMEIDRMFASGAVEEKALQAKLSELADVEAKLRFVHLVAHIKTKAVLSEEQVAHYDHLRGYNQGEMKHHDKTQQ